VDTLKWEILDANITHDSLMVELLVARKEA
jgi:hypothetical protein